MGKNYIALRRHFVANLPQNSTLNMHVKRFLCGHHELILTFGSGQRNFYEDIISSLEVALELWLITGPI